MIGEWKLDERPASAGVEPRPYRGDDDWRAMLDLLIAGRRAEDGSYYVHTGDVSWWLFYTDDALPFSERLFLWQGESGELQGWALLTPDEGYLDVFVHPRLRGTPEAAAMQAWAEARLADRLKARGGDKLRTMWIFETDSIRRGLLETRGFRVGGYALNYMVQPLGGTISAPSAPPGFVARPVAGEQEAEARARASYGAFRSQWAWDRYLARYLRFVRSRVYDRERDMVVAAPDGRLAAFAVYWADHVNGVGLLEPVGTHPDFQRQGLGRLVVTECLRRMQARGLRQAIVCSKTDNAAAVALYQACGFRSANRLLTYEKPLTSA